MAEAVNRSIPWLEKSPAAPLSIFCLQISRNNGDSIMGWAGQISRLQTGDDWLRDYDLPFRIHVKQCCTHFLLLGESKYSV